MNCGKSSFGLDQDLRSAEILHDALNEDPGIVGIYNAGGANEVVASVLAKRSFFLSNTSSH